MPSGDGTRFPMVAPYQVFPTRDGELMLGGGNDRLFRAICAELGVPELVDDPALRDERRPRAESRRARGACSRHGCASTTPRPGRSASRGPACPAAPVADVKDVAESPQTEALGILQRLDHPRIPGLTLAALPLSFDGERALHRSAPPDVGQHSAEILREVGYTDEEIAALAAEGVIRDGR